MEFIERLRRIKKASPDEKNDMTESYTDVCRRLPAEWEPVDAVLLSWPHAATDWAYMLDEVRRCFVDIAKAIMRHARLIVVAPDITEVERDLGPDIDRDRLILCPLPTNDTWARDFGAITTVGRDGRIYLNDFKFNGWGLKFAADRDNLITLAMAENGVFAAERINRLGFVLEGGSIESDGCGLLLTTSECLLSPNRNGDLGRERIEAYLTEALGLKKILWLDHGALEGDDTDSHIDTLARLAPPGDVIFYTGCSDKEDSHYESLRRMAEQLRGFTTSDGRPFNLIELPLPDAVYDPDDASRLPATYANFLILNNAVLLPVYGQPLKDRQAADTLRVAMPGYEIIPIDCRALIRQHGSLHCVTMQFPYNTLAIWKNG